VNSTIVASVAFGGSMVAAVLGMLLHVALPRSHFDEDSKEVIRLVMGLIGTMAALILGLLVASANDTYNAQSGELQSLAADIVCSTDYSIMPGRRPKGPVRSCTTL
jgi:ABC-type spermidine/putrescine transport system permease subunit II